MSHCGLYRRRGVTVIEVLIALGILAIGLSSVVALIPAARSQGARAVILDRASVLAANTLADAATFGLLRSGTDTLIPGGTRPPVMVIDAAGTTLSGIGGVTHPNVLTRVTGIYTGGVAAPAPAQQLIFQGRDDVTITTGTAADDPPVNQVVDGARGFEGRMTSLLCLSGVGTGPYRASVVVFHNRDTSDPATLVLSGTVDNSGLAVNSISPAIPADRTITDIVKPGVVLWAPDLGRFHQAVAVSANGDGSVLYLTLTPGGPLTTGPHRVQILPDSVGMAERMFTPEGVGAFTQ
jgi:prepilin-type N-terminal cleavage/methylation domain-containing protein